ncbi:hypothetical protein BH11MYX2_BH11MYX2_31090 [soil metagenome]
MKSTTVAQYVAALPPTTRAVLGTVRKAVIGAIPKT